eukprot:scaffold57336_cov20-Tisochrysis_lutea.AAC.1
MFTLEAKVDPPRAVSWYPHVSPQEYSVMWSCLSIACTHPSASTTSRLPDCIPSKKLGGGIFRSPQEEFQALCHQQCALHWLFAAHFMTKPSQTKSLHTTLVDPPFGRPSLHLPAEGFGALYKGWLPCIARVASYFCPQYAAIDPNVPLLGFFPRSQEGFRALYKGWLPSVIGVVPYVGLNFAVYETLKAMVLEYYGGWAGGGRLRQCGVVLNAASIVLLIFFYE